MKRFNWEVWKDRYVRGGDDLTLKSLSLTPNAPAYKTLQHRSGREYWEKQRQEYRGKVRGKTRELNIDTMAQVKARHSNTGKAFMGLAVQALNAFHANTPDLSKMKIRDIITLAQVGADLERRALGIDTFNLNLNGIGDFSKLTDAELDELADRIDRLAESYASGEGSTSPFKLN